MSTTSRTTVRRAAGGVLWRIADDGDLEIALVHRPRYDDWSLPKGKLQAGEHPILGAVREVAEETGVQGRLGRVLGQVNYSGKVVDYWAMAAGGGEFVPNDEVDQVRWLPPKAAGRHVSYTDDRALLRTFRQQPAALTTVLLVRHGSAGQRSEWSGDDRERPLDDIGRAQATTIATVLAAYEPTTVIAAARTRCEQTVQPLAAALGLTVQPDEAFTEEAHAVDEVRADRLIQSLAKHGEPTVICSQGGIIPDVVARLTRRDRLPTGKLRSRKGSVWALHFAQSHLVAADYFADLDPGTSPECTSRPVPKD